MRKRVSAIIFFICLNGILFGQLNINYWINSGRDKIISNDNQAAIEYFNTILKFIPDLDEAYYLRAVSKYNLGDYRGALNDLSTAIKLKPYYAYYYLYRGEVKGKLYDLTGAREDFNKAVEFKPNNQDVYLGRGINSMVLKNFDDAISDFNKAININHGNSYAFLYRALAKQSKKLNSEAKPDFDKSILINPYSADAYVRRGRNLCEMKEYKEAIEDFDYAIKIDSGNSFSYFNRAMAKLELNDSLGALHDFDTVVFYDPENALTYFNRAELKSRLNDLEGALSDYDRVIEINPNNIYTYFNRGIVYYMLKEPLKAIDDYTMAINLNPDFAAAYYNRSISRRQLGDYFGATNDYRKSSKINSDRNQLSDTTKLDSTSLAKIIDFKADFEQGNVQVKKSIELGITPFENFDVVYLIKDSIAGYKSHLKSKLPELNQEFLSDDKLVFDNRIMQLPIDTLESLIHSLENIPQTENSGIRLLARSVLKSEKQDFNGALNDCDELVKLRPDFALAFFKRGNTRFNFLSIISSITDFKSDYYFIGKNVSQIKNNQKDALTDYADVIADYQKCIQLDPKFYYTYYNLANVQIESKNFRTALLNFDKAIQLEPLFGEAYFNRGLTHIYLKDDDEGCKDLSKAGELGITSAYGVIKKYCNK